MDGINTTVIENDSKKTMKKSSVKLSENGTEIISENSFGKVVDNAGHIYRIHNDYEGGRSYPTLQDAIFGYHKGKGRPLGVILLR